MTAEPITISVSASVDGDSTARIANRSFETKNAGFTGSYIDWLYNAAFGGRTTIVNALLGEQKIGQATILWHTILVNGQEQLCANLVDLFVDPDHRSYSVVRRIYHQLQVEIHNEPDCSIITVPNPKATPLNRRFLGLVAGDMLDLRVAFVTPKLATTNVATQWRGAGLVDTDEPLLAYPVNPSGNQIPWTAESLARRLSHPERRYAVHQGENCAVVTSARVFRGVKFILICAILNTTCNTISSRELSQVLSTASRVHRWPMFLYVGVNKTVSLPGLRIPSRLRPSPMQIYVSKDLEGASMTRFESIDFDFA